MAVTRSSRRAMTLPETLIAALVLGLVLFVAALAIEGVRGELKRRQAMGLLASLDEALTAYRAATDSWPVLTPGSVPVQPISPAPPVDDRQDMSGDQVIAQLAGVPESRRVLEAVPEVLRVASDDEASAALGTIQDPWGNRLRCLTAAGPLPVDIKAVAANGGRPIFVSAGPDRRFGLMDIAHASDNVRSDELPRK